MPLWARRVAVPPDPIALAAAVADRPGLCLSWDARGGGRATLACDPVEVSDALDPEPALRLVPARDDRALAARWFGLVPYEARRALERPAQGRAREDRPPPHLERPLWLRYGAVAEIGPDGVRVVGDSAAAVRELALRLTARAPLPGARLELVAVDDDALHAERVLRALELIARGELYQVNLARRFRYRVAGHVLGLAAAMARVARAPHCLCWSHGERGVAGTSPELCLELSADRRLLTVPIKGTRPRGRDAVEDGRLARELEADAKERAELAMIVDVERNDFGRVAVTGSIRLQAPPRVEAHATVHHRAARIVARLRTDVDRAQLLEATLPSGSVTGAPKVRAMEAIATLEPQRRGLYTGAFGTLAHDGSLRLAMAIRTLTLLGDEAHYFAGGGIVADSVPAREVEETSWKAVQVARVAATAPPKIGLIASNAGTHEADRHGPLPTSPLLDC